MVYSGGHWDDEFHLGAGRCGVRTVRCAQTSTNVAFCRRDELEAWKKSRTRVVVVLTSV
jgi:hypothetical protein